MIRTILDELFDLSGRGKWFRRQISQLCTTILENSFFAGKITHRMKEITEELTSDETVSGYIIKLTESLFPQGSSFFMSKFDLIIRSLIDHYYSRVYYTRYNV